MKTNTISSKIKIIGTLYMALFIVMICATIMLNHNNKKDSLLINIAGKQRMLTQKISKNIFYLYHNNSTNFTELDKASNEFIYNLNSLKNGNSFLGIVEPQTDEIKNQISKVEILWNTFYKNTRFFKENMIKQNKKQLTYVVNSIYESNNELLIEVDKLVYMYTTYTESKTTKARYIEYTFLILLIILSIYSFYELNTMEENAKKFFELSKQLANGNENEPLKPIKIEAEKEIVEASDTINCFINKINTAVEYSTNASNKLDEITEELDEMLLTLNKSSELSKKLDQGEDIVIQSQENMINSTKKLKELKEELNKVAKII